MPATHSHDDAMAQDRARQDRIDRLGRQAATQMSSIIADAGIEDVHTFKVAFSDGGPEIKTVTVGPDNVVFHDRALRGMLSQTDWARSPAFVGWTEAVAREGFSSALLHVEG